MKRFRVRYLKIIECYEFTDAIDWSEAEENVLNGDCDSSGVLEENFEVLSVEEIKPEDERRGECEQPWDYSFWGSNEED
jgi:tetrahydromethanopterin S-methyltransferase subunit A